MKKIIFDLDDTLIDTKKDARKAYEIFLKKHDYNCNFDQLYEALEDLTYMDNPTMNDFYLFLKKFLGTDFNKEDFSEFNEIYINEVNLINEETIEILKYLSEKYELVILTNWFYELQYGKLKKLGIDKYFSEVYTIDTTGKKPDLNVLKKACDPYSFNECAIVGDSLMSDILVSKKLGMRAIYFGKSEDLECISDIRELKTIL